MIRPVFLCVSFPLIACSAALAQDKTSLNRGGYGSVMTPEQVVRELGPETGLLPGDQAYEGRPVKSVSVRYRSTGKTVSEDRLKNLLATQPGTNYSPEVVNKDLERLLESGLVGGNTTVAVEPSGDGVTVDSGPGVPSGRKPAPGSPTADGEACGRCHGSEHPVASTATIKKTSDAMAIRRRRDKSESFPASARERLANPPAC